MEFIYKLILVDRLFSERNWTSEDDAITSRHFNHLLKLKEDNRLILAGKTAGLDLDTYGVVIFRADSYQEAKVIMKSDPAIKEGIMRGHLKEFNVALLNENYKK